MHEEKEKDCNFFVVQGGSPAGLGIPDIDSLGVLTINCEKKGRQVAHRQQEEKLPMQKSNSNRRQEI